MSVTVAIRLELFECIHLRDTRYSHFPTWVMSNVDDFLLQVDMAMLHSHLYEHSLQGVAATISLANLLIATLRYNERLTGKT